jgi:uncharacterized protein
MSALSRLLVTSGLLGAVIICAARAQADPRDMRIGEPSAMYALGVMFDEGMGVEIDDRRAFEWYERAAKHGHAESMNRLGILYLSGRGVPLNAAAALAWFRLAAAKGSLTAINNIALLYFYGFGVNQSYSQAAQLLRRSADKGNADAQNKLAGMYDDGLGVVRDPRRAKALYLQAAAQGHLPAMANLGRMLTQENSGETRDIFPYPFIGRSSGVRAPTGTGQALLTISDSRSSETTSVACARWHLEPSHSSMQ